METKYVVKETWLSLKPFQGAYTFTLLTGLFVFLTSFIFLNGFYNADIWMEASAHSVFNDHQYWKAWTTLFAHADAGHLLANSMLLLPLTLLLVGHFGFGFFPAAAILMGGLVNFIVLKTMPENATLIGISGVVSWMGGAWLALWVLIDRRESLRKRLGIALFISLFLFAPENYKPEVSYLSHFLGYIFGVATGVGFYYVNRQKFLAAEVKEFIVDEPEFTEEPLPAMACKV